MRTESIKPYEMFKPPLALRVYVRSISTEESRTEYRIEFSMHAPQSVASVLQKLAERGEGESIFGCSVEVGEPQSYSHTITAAGSKSECDFEVRLIFGEVEPSRQPWTTFSAVAPVAYLTSVEAFYDYLGVLLRLEAAPRTGSTIDTLIIDDPYTGTPSPNQRRLEAAMLERLWRR